MELPQIIIRQQIKRGTVLLSDCFEEIDHSKFFVIIGVYNDTIAGFFFINSRIHPVLQNKPEQFAMQYILKREKYSFLNYDSFLCATEIQVKSVQELADSIIQGQTMIKGELCEEDIDFVLEACRKSRLFTVKEKKKFFY